jgi:hypothetical protein
MDTNYQACNYDCIDKGTYTVLQCFTKCEACITTASCWTSVDYGITSDRACYTNCYDLCDDYWPTTSTLCNCD